MGFFRTFGSHLGAGLADVILDRIAPPPPSLAQRILDEAPKVLAFVTMIANAVRVATVPVGQTRASSQPSPSEIMATTRATPSPIPGIPLRADDFPPFKKLGEFTCPKCGGHTWGWTGVNGVDENGTHIRRCTGQMRDVTGEHGHGCVFTWKATDDAKYFSSVEVGPAPESAAVGVSWEDKFHALERHCQEIVAERDALLSGVSYDGLSTLAAVVGKRRQYDEAVSVTASRLLRDADAFIAKQAAEIARQADVIKGYKFAVGCGEIQIQDTGTLCLGVDGWSLRTDDGSKVTTVPVSAKEAAGFLSTATGTLFEAHAIGSPMGRMNEYAKESAERSAIKDAIATSDAEVSASDYVERQAPRYNRAEIAMERTHCASCGAERGRKCEADCANSNRLKVKP